MQPKRWFSIHRIAAAAADVTVDVVAALCCALERRVVASMEPAAVMVIAIGNNNKLASKQLAHNKSAQNKEKSNRNQPCDRRPYRKCQGELHWNTPTEARHTARNHSRKSVPLPMARAMVALRYAIQVWLFPVLFATPV